MEMRKWIYLGPLKSVVGRSISYYFVCCFLFDNKLCASFNTVELKPYAFSFSMSNSWSRQSKSFDKSVSKVPNISLLSTDLFYFRNIARRDCHIGISNPHWYFQNLFSISCDFCSSMHFSNIFDKFGKMLTGL